MRTKSHKSKTVDELVESIADKSATIFCELLNRLDNINESVLKAAEAIDEQNRIHRIIAELIEEKVTQKKTT